MLRIPLIAVLLLVAGCDRPPAPAPKPDTATADAALLARIEALAPGQRDALLFRAIRDARHPCQGIAAAARIADVMGRPAWSARCDNGARFLLVLQPGGHFWVTARGGGPAQP